jgi:hypothetical protein
MRRMVIGLAAVAAVAACEERHLRGVVGTPGGSGSATVQVVVVDDPAGAEPVLSSGARPTVSVRFAAALLRAGLAANVPDTGSLFAQVPIDSAVGALVATTDSVPAGSYVSIRLTLLEATLAMPGAAPVDLLAGTPAPSITRDAARAVSDGELVTLRIDLNSDGWLVPNPTPGAGPEFLFTGATDFLTALAVTLP